MNTTQPGSSLVIDTKEVGRRPGSMASLSRTIEAPADLGTDVIAVPEGQEIDLDLRLESVVEGVLVTGTGSAVATGACVRCLTEVHPTVDIRFQELFVWPDRVDHHREVGDDEDEEEYRIENELIDLEPVLRDTVVPSLPFQPVCREDCPGLCSQCGARLADDPDHQHDVIDPRWAALEVLRPLAETAGESPAETDEGKRN